MADSPAELERLLGLARNGDRDAQGRLLDHFRPQLCEWARRRIEGKIRVRIDESEIARRLDRTETAAAGLLKRGLAKLREQLKNESGG